MDKAQDAQDLAKRLGFGKSCEEEPCGSPDCPALKKHDCIGGEYVPKATLVEELREALQFCGHTEEWIDPDLVEKAADEIEHLRTECRDKAGVLRGTLDTPFAVPAQVQIVVHQVAEFLEKLADGK